MFKIKNADIILVSAISLIIYQYIFGQHISIMIEASVDKGPKQAEQLKRFNFF